MSDIDAVANRAVEFMGKEIARLRTELAEAKQEARCWKLRVDEAAEVVGRLEQERDSARRERDEALRCKSFNDQLFRERDAAEAAHAKAVVERDTAIAEAKRMRDGLGQLENEADYAVKEDRHPGVSSRFNGHGHLNADWVLEKVRAALSAPIEKKGEG